MYDIIIIGAGPAGLTAALYARRANKKVLVLEAKSYGGQIINTRSIENYPGLPNVTGYDFATALYNQVVNLNAEIKFETVLKINEDKTVVTRKNEYKAKAIIIATGAEKRKLGILNEEKYNGKGISYCATCDGNFYKNKIVAVIGSGKYAIEDAIYLSDLANKVYLINDKEDFDDSEKKLPYLKSKSNIEIITKTIINRIIGQSKIDKIEIRDASDRIKEIDVDGIFVAIGQAPKNDIFSNVIKLDEKGYIISEDGVHTSTDGIYVAGDARVKTLRQLTTAVSDGSIAATTAIKELKD